MIRALLVSSLVFLAACPPSQSPPGPDASDGGGDVASRVCAHLAEIGCPQPPSCVAVYRANEKLVDFRPSCLLAASSAPAAQVCGSVHCLGTTDTGP